MRNEEDTYDIAPEELRRTIRAVKSDPKRVLLLKCEYDVKPHELLAGITSAVPQLEGRVYRATMIREPNPRFRPCLFGEEFTQCATLDQVERLASESIGEGTVLEVLVVTREPMSINWTEQSIVEDIKAVMEGRNGYIFFQNERVEWSINAHPLLPKCRRAAIRTFMLARRRGGSGLQCLPLDVVYQIFVWL